MYNQFIATVATVATATLCLSAASALADAKVQATRDCTVANNSGIATPTLPSGRYPSVRKNSAAR